MIITINNQEYKSSSNSTILDVARQNGIYIPTLCAHPELIPYGGCRICIVEIESRKGFPTACTTRIEDGMVVRTETQVLQQMRRDLIQMILSEHTSACLVCDEIGGCTGYQETIRKVGVTTGCRWCPKDQDCELQKVVEYLDIHELTLPGLYRGFPVEKNDPFYDRDYNLCIYCGRCVGICTEYRKSNVLSLKQRGNKTTIGPAYEDSHIDAGCEFCGACVSVCPTGSLSEKSRKWWGAPEKMEESVCPLCSLNCDLQVITLKNKIVGALPPGNPHEAGGELCVKGRFCLSEIINRTDRIQEPQLLYPEGYAFVPWDEAIHKTSEIIQSVKPKRTAVFISPGLSLEEIAAAGQFSEKVLKTDLITSSCMDENLPAYMDLAIHSSALDEVKNAKVILSLFLHGNYNYAPLTMAIKEAASTGANYYPVGWLWDTTTRFARERIRPLPGKETDYMEEILSCLKGGKTSNREIGELVRSIREKKNTVVVLSPEVMSLSFCWEISLIGAKHFMPNPYGNLYGLLSRVKLHPLGKIYQEMIDGKLDLMYFIGDAPFQERPPVKYLVYQNAFQAPAGLRSDVLLPTTTWGETPGSYMDVHGHIRKAPAVAMAHRYELSHKEVFSKIGGFMKIKPGKLSPVTKLPKDIEMVLSANVNKGSLQKDNPSPGEFTHVLIQEKNQHIYCNLSLGEGLEGFGDLVKPGHILINPKDAQKAGLKDGDEAILTSSEGEKKFRFTFRKIIPKGNLYLVTRNGKLEFIHNPCLVNIKKENV
jgi:ferredoxin